MALSAARSVPLEVGHVTVPVDAATTIYKGAIVAANVSGLAVPAADAEDYVVIGIAESTADNADGQAGDIGVHAIRGRFRLPIANTAGLQSMVGRTVYVYDDEKVAAEADSVERVPCGTVVRYISTTELVVRIGGEDDI